MPEKVRRLVQDMWFPVHNFVSPSRTVVWSCIESSPVSNTEPNRRNTEHLKRADNLFHNTVSYRINKKRKLTKRFMCHLTKVWQIRSLNSKKKNTYIDVSDLSCRNGATMPIWRALPRSSRARGRLATKL
jgi:hypothetical protein